jgi:hypothetical protein
MTKFNEITDEAERRAKSKYIEELWSGWRQARETTLARINNYLFTLNTGALLASLTYVAAKENSADINFSIWVFSIGILCSVLHAAIDYYSVEKYFTNYRTDVKSLYDNEMEWEDFITKSSKRRKLLDWLLHSIGWVSGISFIVALINGIIQLN